MQMFHNLLFIIRIQGIGGFVEEKKFRIFIHGTRYQQTLFLPLTDTVSLHTDFGVIPQWKRVYEITDIGYRHGMAQPLHINLLLSHSNILRNGFRKDKAVLHHGSRLGTPQVGIYVL